MALRDFADKWHNGAVESASSRFNGKTLDELHSDAMYSARDVADMLGFTYTMNINQACRNGLVIGAVKGNTGEWNACGEAWKDWRTSMGRRRFSLRDRLRRMSIRQINESTGEVRLAHVVDCIVSGTKPVFRIEAGEFSTVATANHLFMTSSGWKRLGDITPGVDALVVYRYGTGAHEDRFRKIDGKWVCQWSRSIRDEVFRRQKGLCGHTDEPLLPGFHVHHIQPRHLRPDLAFDIENVMAVNASAHKDIHGEQGWQNGVPLGTQVVQVDSVKPEGFIDTYDLEIDGDFPNFFADGIVVHNSRNASSSRAIPVERMIQDVLDDPAMPIFWGKNQPGMSAAEELDKNTKERAIRTWLFSRDKAVADARYLKDIGAHKQIVNRLLEPWLHINVLITSTDWSNFFALRRHEAAQPEMRALADAIYTCMQESTPTLLKHNEWHRPYVDWKIEIDRLPLPPAGCKSASAWFNDCLNRLSTARCARLSYLTHDMRVPNVEEDLALAARLVGSQPLHASPAEHQATPDTQDSDNEFRVWDRPDLHGNFRGWIQYRKCLKNENVPDR